MIIVMEDSHIAVKKYWIISRVVEVITSQSDKFITLTSDDLNHKWYYPILFGSFIIVDMNQKVFLEF